MIRNIRNLLEIFAYLYCLSELFGRKLKINIYAVVLVILDLFLLTGVYRYGFPDYLLSLVYIGMFLYGLINYGESIKRTLVNCFLAAAIVLILQLLVLFPLYYLFFINYEQNEINELLINIVCLFLIILCAYIIKLKRLSDFFIKRNKVIVGVATLFLCGLGLKLYQIIKEGNIFGEAYIQMLYFLFIFLFTIYEWQKSKTDAERKRAQLEMNRLYYDAYDQLIMLVRERQHDMKSHINAIMGMIYTTDNYDELATKQKEYCGFVLKQNEKTRLVLSTGNPLISGFLYSKMLETESKSIKLEYHIGITEKDMSIPEYELIEMMGILVDNAIEALTKNDNNIDNECNYGENLEKKIYFSLKGTEKYLELVVSNTSAYFDEDMTQRFFDTGYSSKGKGRGIGLAKLKRMVHDRKGNIIVSNELHGERNYLVFAIMLPIIDEVLL